MNVRSLVALVSLLATATLHAQSGMLRYPEIRGDRVLFAHAGDLWSVPASGGNATRMTSHAGYEYLPRFSPDGRWIAFSAEYEGNMDVYVMPATGGEPKRLTFHPYSDRVTGWTPDGRIAFRSKRTSEIQQFDKLFTVPVTGGWPAELPLTSANLSSFSPDGMKVAYNRVSGETRFWKRYRGGTQSWISISDLRTNAYDEVPHGDAADLWPMWFRNAIYFVSDRDGVMNLWRYDVATKALRQLTQYREFDIKWPSLAADGTPQIVFENGGQLFRFDLEKETTSAIPIQVTTDAPAIRPALITIDKPIESIGLSPSGARALITARGELFTLPVKHGETRNLTNSSGARETGAVWSPDGRSIAYASDKSGEYEIWIRRQDGSNETKLTSLGPGFRSALVWSPDAKKIAFADSSLSLDVIETTTPAKLLHIDRSDYGPITQFDWSPDGQWLVYAKLEANQLNRLFAYSFAAARSFPLTDGMTDDTSPAFDRGGKYLWFLSKRNFKPSFSDFEKSFNFNATTGVYLLTLRADTLSPFAPKNDEEPDGTPPAKATEPPFRIDVAGIAERVVRIAVDPGDYKELRARDGKAFYLAGQSLRSYDLGSRAEKTLIDGITMYALDRADHVIYRAGSKIGVIASDAESKPGDGALDLSSMTMTLDRRAEWKQIFNEAWRMERDSFYDPLMRGVDWAAMKVRYEKELPFVASRNDLNVVIGEMIAELGVSHLNASGGDLSEVKRSVAGLLGADYTIENGRYRFRRIYRGDNAQADSTAPLAQPGMRVSEGDYLLAVNGNELRGGDELFAAFDNTAGKQVRLLVNAKPSMDGARELVVTPIENDGQLRYLDWVEANRRRVDAGTNGRCAYIHVPDTADRGTAAFGRWFYAQTDKRCLLLDARFNSGGFIPDFLFEHLSRRHLEYDTPRHGADVEYQQAAIHGPKVLVINEYAGSGGDSVADYFRKYALGPIVGRRTWGGLMGIGEERPMIDGGRVNVPHVSAWDVIDGKSEWIVENRGVPPDIDVDQRPDLVLAGNDPQLDRGIAILNERLAKEPYVKPVRPPYGAPKD